MSSPVALAFLVAAVTAVLVTPAVIRLAAAYELYDHPTGGRRVHTDAVPRIGGVAIFLATLLGLGAAARFSPGPGLGSAGSSLLPFVLLGGGVLFLVGMTDDLRGLTPRSKIIGQMAAGVVFWMGGLRLEQLVLGSELGARLAWISLPLVVLWVVAVTNAFNLIDGLDGLACGIALVALLSTVAVSVLIGRAEVMVVAAAMVGALLGFLRYNFRPARIFLGDSGSLFIGGMLALLSVHGIRSGATAVLMVAPLFALAVPLIDAILAILRRWLRGVPFSEADRRHIHHQLLARGLTHLRAVLALHVVALTLAVLGLLIAFAPATPMNIGIVVAGLASVLLLLWGMGYLKYHEFTEALSVLAWAPRRLRRVIRDQIHARDVAQVIAGAKTLEEVNAILGDNASNFRFLDMELCLESDAGHARPVIIEHGRRVHPRKFEYPVHALDHHGDTLYVLRIWCHIDSARPAGAERVAGVLGPELGDWIRGRVAEATSLRGLSSRDVPNYQPAELHR